VVTVEVPVGTAEAVRRFRDRPVNAVGVGTLVAVVAAAVVGGQLWLGDLFDMLWRSDGADDGGSAVPGGFISVTWFAAGGVVTGVAAGRAIGGSPSRRWPLVASAAVGVLVSAAVYAAFGLGALPDARPPDEQEIGSAEDTYAAAVGGVLVGAAFGPAALRYRSVARGLVFWIGWVWIVMAQRLAIPEWLDFYPLGVPNLERAVEPSGWLDPVLVTLVPLVAIAPAAGLGWWAARRGDARPVFSGAVGPVLMLSAHAATLVVGVNAWDDDHYSTGADLATWLSLSLYAVGAAAFGALAARAWRNDMPGRAVGTALLGWGAVVLATATLDWGPFGVVAAAVGALSGAVGLAIGRGRRLSLPAGVLAAVAGPVGLFLLGFIGFGEYIGEPVLAVQASEAVEMPFAAFGAVVGGAALLGAFVRRPRVVAVVMVLVTITFAVVTVRSYPYFTPFVP
jgi:hypothetical protein